MNDKIKYGEKELDYTKVKNRIDLNLEDWMDHYDYDDSDKTYFRESVNEIIDALYKGTGTIDPKNKKFIGNLKSKSAGKALGFLLTVLNDSDDLIYNPILINQDKKEELTRAEQAKSLYELLVKLLQEAYLKTLDDQFNKIIEANYKASKYSLTKNRMDLSNDDFGIDLNQKFELWKNSQASNKDRDNNGTIDINDFYKALSQNYLKDSSYNDLRASYIQYLINSNNKTDWEITDVTGKKRTVYILPSPDDADYAFVVYDPNTKKLLMPRIDYHPNWENIKKERLTKEQNVGKPVFKEGGIIKAQQGEKFNWDPIQKSDVLNEQEDSTKLLDKVKKESEKHFSNNIKLSELENYELTESDIKRLFSLSLDVASIIDPEPISAAGLGLSSDYLTWLADKLDGINDSAWDDVGNVALSVFGAIPAAGDLGMIGKIIKKIPKSLKTLTRLAAIPSVAIVLDLHKELKNTYNKLLEGGKNLTIEDARNIHTILTLVLGGINAGKSMHAKHKANKIKNTEGTNTLQITGTKNGKKETLNFTGDDADLIKSGPISEVKTLIESKNPGFVVDINKSRNFIKDKFWKIPYPKLLTTEYIPYREIKTGYNIPTTSEAWKSLRRHKFFLKKEGGIIKAQTGTPLWFKKRYKDEALEGWSRKLDSSAYTAGGKRGEADSLNQVWETNYAYSQDNSALQNDLTSFYTKNKNLSIQDTINLYNSKVKKLNDFWNSSTKYNLRVDIAPIFHDLYGSRHSDNSNYGLGYQENLSTYLGSTMWNRRALAYENDLNTPFNFGNDKVAFNKDGTIRLLTDLKVEVLPQTGNLSKNLDEVKAEYPKTEDPPELLNAPKEPSIIGLVLNKLGLYFNYQGYNKEIYNVLRNYPLYQVSYPQTNSRKVYGNLRAIIESLKKAGEAYSEGYRAMTSNARDEAARLYNMFMVGSLSELQGLKDDDLMYRKTDAELRDYNDKLLERIWLITNQNSKYIYDKDVAKKDAKIKYLASSRQATDTLLKNIEGTINRDRIAKFLKEFEDYEEYIRNYALQYPLVILDKQDLEIYNKVDKSEQELNYYNYHILPKIELWIKSNSRGTKYTLPIIKSEYKVKTS